MGGVILLQKDDENPKDWATVGYQSKNLSKEQRNYFEIEKECYTLVMEILTLRSYLECTHLPVRTDHNALK